MKIIGALMCKTCDETGRDTFVVVKCATCKHSEPAFDTGSGSYASSKKKYCYATSRHVTDEGFCDAWKEKK